METEEERMLSTLWELAESVSGDLLTFPSCLYSGWNDSYLIFNQSSWRHRGRVSWCRIRDVPWRRRSSGNTGTCAS